jgi:hypothetical protein
MTLNLQLILRAEADMIAKYKTKKTVTKKPDGGEIGHYDHYEGDAYADMLDDVRQLFSNVQLTETDLQTYLLTDTWVTEAEDKNARALFSATLLETLTEQHKAKHLPTRFYFNGQCKTFDSLFHAVRNIDELIVEQFQGNYLCSWIGVKGRVNSLVMNNNKGWHAASHAGAWGGRIGSVIIMNQQGNCAAHSVGEEGWADLVMVLNSTGSHTASSAAACRGYVGAAIVAGCEGYRLLGSLTHIEGALSLAMALDNDLSGDNHGHLFDKAGTSCGTIKLLYAGNNKGDLAFHELADYDGLIGAAVLKDNDGRNACFRAGITGTVKRIIASGSELVDETSQTQFGPHPLRKADQTLTGTDADTACAELEKAYRLNEIAQLARSAASQPYRQVLRTAERIKEIYKDINSELNSLM